MDLWTILLVIHAVANKNMNKKKAIPVYLFLKEATKHISVQYVHNRNILNLTSDNMVHSF